MSKVNNANTSSPICLHFYVSQMDLIYHLNSLVCTREKKTLLRRNTRKSLPTRSAEPLRIRARSAGAQPWSCGMLRCPARVLLPKLQPRLQRWPPSETSSFRRWLLVPNLSKLSVAGKLVVRNQCREAHGLLLWGRQGTS